MIVLCGFQQMLLGGISTQSMLTSLPVFPTYYLYCGLMGCDTMHSYSSYSVSEENVASIFNTEHSSEILVPTYKTTGCNKTEDCLYSLLSHAMMG